MKKSSHVEEQVFKVVLVLQTKTEKDVCLPHIPLDLI